MNEKEKPFELLLPSIANNNSTKIYPSGCSLVGRKLGMSCGFKHPGFNPH